MLKLFKTKIATIPFAVIFIFMLCTRILMFLKKYKIETWETPLSPFSLGLTNILGTLSNNLLFQLFASFILILIQINLISVIVSSLKDNIWKSFITPWVFILCMHLHPQFLLLSPQLISFTLILASLYTLLKIENTPQSIKYIYTSSLLVGLAAVFWLPSVFFILMLIFYIQRIKILALRTLLVTLIGVLTPFIYVTSYVYFTGLKNVFYNTISFNKHLFHEINVYENLSIHFVFILGFFSLIKVSGFMSNQLKETKTFFTLILIYCISFLLIYFLHFHKNINVWIFLSLPISLILNIFFNSFKRIFIAELIHVVLLLIILVNFIHLLN